MNKEKSIILDSLTNPLSKKKTYKPRVSISRKKTILSENDIFFLNILKEDHKLNFFYNKHLYNNLFILKSNLDIIHDTKSLCTLLENYYINTNEKWVECNDDCSEICRNKIENEINSTIFYLQMLSNILISIESGYKIEFKILNYLTGLWKDDYKNIEMYVKNIDGDIDKGTGSTRLIMGFGPSASGKSYNTLCIIELMSIIEAKFPKYFLSIDGGIFREKSHIYQTILRCKSENLDGYSNLVKPDPRLGLFDASFVKQNIVIYLNYIKSNYNFKISLYIPETLPSCNENVCLFKYLEYIRLTDDTDWIGLLIYQHKTDKECDLQKFTDYACLGTTFSGKKRELQEGKKYSNNEWLKSYDNGYREMMKAPRYRFKLHNTGRHDGINIFYDYSKPYLNLDENIRNFFSEKNWIYKKESNILS
jgi:hypothetical protein